MWELNRIIMITGLMGAALTGGDCVCSRIRGTLPP